MLSALVLAVSISSPEAFKHYQRLLLSYEVKARSGEVGAFLVLRDETLVAVPWRQGDSRSVTFSGKAPAGCIAIMHTHPGRELMPSTQDVLEAQRLGIPLIVVTPYAVTVANPDGTVSQLAGWKWLSR